MADFGNTNILARAAGAVGANTQPMNTNQNKPDACFKQVTHVPKYKSPGKQDDISKLTQQIKEFTAKIKAETDCASLQQTAKALVEHGQNWAEGKMKRAAKDIADAVKQMGIPSPNPISIVKWIVKKVTGDALPKLEAGLRSIMEVIQLITAVSDLIATMAEVPSKLEECAKSFVQAEKQELINAVNDFVDREACKLQQAISKEISDALKSGDSNPSGTSISDFVSDLTQTIQAFHTMQGSINNTMNAVLGDVGSAQSQITAITGGDNHIDTSSIDNFINSMNGGAADNLVSDTLTYTTQAEANCTTLPVITGNASYTNSISVDTGTWLGDGLNYSYQWWLGDQTNTFVVPTMILGANTNTYQPHYSDVGNVVFCQVIANNNISQGWANSLNSAVITNSYNPLVNISIVGNTQTGNTVSLSYGTWATSAIGNPTDFVYSYQWVWAHSNTPISSATASTYSPAALDAGQTLKCYVTISNTVVGGNVTLVSSESAMVTSPPINTSAPVASNNGSTLITTTNGVWSGYPSAYMYQWYYTANNGLVNGATSPSYNGAVSTYYYCQVTAMNQFGVVSANSNSVLA